MGAGTSSSGCRGLGLPQVRGMVAMEETEDEDFTCQSRETPKFRIVY